MMKSVAQLSLKPINYDGVHALPINECVKDAAHETDLSIRFIQQVETVQYAFVCSVTRLSDNQKLRGDILYATTRDVVSLKGFKY
ncbi:hypothetical protein CWM53_11085 [Klebsiella sp. A-Nf5]|nr:hypothetical protein CWM61_21150 [Klebsiella sp. K-Nf6]PJX32139.1 hypothetical protein CWM53_11085 [Klebsiella sp. A-Nf5]PJX35599.1 hypothetical protein CWM59_22390 [Klebsiella sp. B-Nf7]PJX46347.1 hypothetical protein CWM60_22455 [Klebsiella sp. C1-16S-Nf17]